jgi:hypothetical protein
MMLHKDCDPMNPRVNLAPRASSPATFLENGAAG